MIDISKLSPAQLDRFIHIQGVVDRQQAAQEKIRALREYYYGSHPVLLTMRQQEYLGKQLTEGAFSFQHNLVRSVVDTLRERLDVAGYTVNGMGAEDEEEGSPDSALAGQLWDWWLNSRMDSQQIRLYRRTLRDGKSYVMVDYDNEAGAPRFTLHKADDGQTGITYHRDPTDANRVMFACRYFYTFDPLKPGETGIERKTVYLPGEIRKYVRSSSRNGGWEPYTDDGDGAWPLPWVDMRGNPLGVPVIEFENPGGSEIEQIIGLQNALNKAWLDLIAAADTSGFPLIAIEYKDAQLFGPGTASDDDLEGTDELRFSPGRAIEVANATVKRLEAAQLQPMIDTIWAITAAISGVSRTPQYYLRPIGGADVPSGEALKQLESGLVKRAEERQLMFGQSWADAMTLAVRVAQMYGGITSVPNISQLNIETTWQDPNVRNDLSVTQVAQAYKALDVPQDQIWMSLGFTPAEIAAFKQQGRDDRAADVATIAAALNVQQQRQSPNAAPLRGNGAGAPVSTNGTGGAR